MAVRSPQDIYARHVSSSRGYPMWTPEPSSQLLSYRPEGLRIGDVGVVVPDNGNFDVFFNLCLSKDHHFHKATGVPDGFTPIELNDDDIKTVQNADSAGQVLTSSSVTRVGGEDISGDRESPLRASQSGAPGYRFSFSSNEGALLILPEGADRHDVRDPRPFFEQACRNAETWYRFAEEELGRIISHDSIYVITGFHKARSWGLAGYENEQGDSEFPARFIPIGVRDGGKNTVGSYTWETTRNIDWRVGPHDGLGLSNQSVFIRGFKIALRSTVQGVPQRWISYQPSRPNVGPNRGGDSWLASVWRGISEKIGLSTEEADREENEDTDIQVEISRVPEILPVFHPSDVINQYILQEEPSAKVAITHDNVWGSILDKSALKPEGLVQDDLLTKAVSENYTIVSREGVAYLQSNSGLDGLVDLTADESRTIEPADQAQVCVLNESSGVIGENTTQPCGPCQTQPLSVVSESNFRCVDSSAPGLASVDSEPAGLHSIPSKFGASGSPAPESLRPIKIIVLSDYICAFCYVCDKFVQDAVEACRNLPVRFDVEFRPFTIVNASCLPADSNQVVYRNAYIAKKYGKEQAEMKLKAANEFATKAGLKLADDSVVCVTTQAHRLSAKAYKIGGRDLQEKFNTFIFDACLAKMANINDEHILVDAAASVGVMDKEEARAFLHSTECLDIVEKTVEAAKARGINGVPFVIIDGKWAVNGLQPVECFIQIFRKLAQLPASKTGQPSLEVQ